MYLFIFNLDESTTDLYTSYPEFQTFQSSQGNDSLKKINDLSPTYFFVIACLFIEICLQ